MKIILMFPYILFLSLLHLQFLSVSSSNLLSMRCKLQTRSKDVLLSNKVELSEKIYNRAISRWVDDCGDCGENSKHQRTISVFHSACSTTPLQDFIILPSDQYRQNGSLTLWAPWRIQGLSVVRTQCVEQ